MVEDLEITEKDRNRIWGYVNKTEGCWLWTASCNGTAKKPQINVRGFIIRVHRLFYEKFNGPLKPKEMVKSACRNSRCVNPAHLRKFSHLDLEWASLRFWPFVKKMEGCWEWMGKRGPKGYGIFNYNYRSVNAQRISWMINNGPIPNKLLVCHRCDNPPCVNPEHLFIGTHQNNMDDRQRKGRTLSGEKHYETTLTWQEVHKIRTEYVPIKGNMVKLAEKYSVHPSVVSNIIHRKTWKS